MRNNTGLIHRGGIGNAGMGEHINTDPEEKRMQAMMKHKGRYLITTLVLIILDQITKGLAVLNLEGNPPVPLIPGILELQYVENRGAAFGILQNRQWFFLLISIVILAAILFVLKRIPEGRRFTPLCLGLSILAAGAVGNMIDRVLHGYVVDFIYFKPIDFPVFNVADIYVTCSAVLLAFLFLLYYDEEEIDALFKKKM